jgi:hypothetical protein
VTAKIFISGLIAEGRYCFSAEEVVGDFKYQGEI